MHKTVGAVVVGAQENVRAGTGGRWCWAARGAEGDVGTRAQTTGAALVYTAVE